MNIFFTTPCPACTERPQQRLKGQADAPDAAALCRPCSRFRNAGKNMQVVIAVDMIRLYARRLHSLNLSKKLPLDFTGSNLPPRALRQASCFEKKQPS